MEKIKELPILEEKSSVKYRHWLILLYDDSTSYDFKNVLQIVKGQKNYAYIKHMPEETEKKPHYHVILSFENATKKETLAKKLGIPSNYIDPIKNFRTICRYLIHKDDEDKFQYDLSQVRVSTCFDRKFKMQFNDIESEDMIIDNIYNFITKLSNEKYIEAQRLLIQYVNTHCYDTIYKRYRFEFLDYLKNTCTM